MGILLWLVTNSEQDTSPPCTPRENQFNCGVNSAEPVSPACPGCQRAKGYRLPIHQQFFDGRSDHDWHLSILAWLEYRIGPWRPVRHSGPCAVQDFRDAKRLVMQAFHSQQVEPVPLAVPKRPPVSVKCVTQELTYAQAASARS